MLVASSPCSLFCPLLLKILCPALKVLFGSLFLFALTGVEGARQQQIVIHCSSQTIVNHPDLLRNSQNEPLSAGFQRNGDGHLISLGYYSQADDSSISNHFKGNWIPLTEGTRIGDSSTGYGFGDGMFSFTTSFTLNSEIVNIFPTEPAFFQLTAPHPITNVLPGPGKPLCIRFYDNSEISKTTKYNAVTGANWLWPTFSGGIPENLYLKIANGTPPPRSNWLYGNTLQYPADSFRTIEPAEYVPNLYSLHVTHNDGGTVNDVNASYPEDSTVNLTASPNPHMEFEGWLGDGVSDPLFPMTAVFMTKDRNITAIFKPKLYELDVTFSGVGDISGSGQYAHGTTVPITATPSLGYEFSHWEGFGIDANTTSTTLQISQDQSIKAVFLPKQHTFVVSTNNASHGTTQIIQSPPYRTGGVYDIIAQPSSGHIFSHWSSTNGARYMLDSNTSHTTKVRLSDDALFFANFVEIQYNLEILMGDGGNSVTPSSGNFGVNQSIPVTATPLDGYEFTKWHDPSGLIDDPYLSSSNIQMSRASGNSFVKAIFNRKHYDVVISSGVGGNVIFNPPNGPWIHFGIYSIQAVPNPGYQFVSWTGNQDSIDSLLLSNDQSANQISVTGDIGLNAHFTPESYTVSVSSGTGGSATGSGVFSVGDNPSIEATPLNGWEFSHWDGNETHLTLLTSTTSPSTFLTLTEAPPVIDFEAVFKRPDFEISVSVAGGGEVNGQTNQIYLVEAGTDFSLQASPLKGWSFSRWFGIENNSSSEPSLTFTASSNVSITADFTLKNYLLTISQTSGGEANGTGTYNYNENIGISAIPKSGYKFEKWTGDIQYLNSVSNNPAIVTMPDSNISLTPVFEMIPINITVTVTGSGNVQGEGQYNPQETFTLSAVGNSANDSAPRGFGLLKWSWNDASGNTITSTENPLVISSSQDLFINAEFYPIPPDEINLNLANSPSGAGIIFDDPDQRIWNIDTDTIDRNISVIPQAGFSFIGWSVSPSTTLLPHWQAPQIIAGPETDSNLTAHYKPLLHKFGVSFNSDFGNVSSFQNQYNHGETFTLTAEPKEHFVFQGWEISKTNNFAITSKASSVKSEINVLYADDSETPDLILARGHTYSFDTNLNVDTKFYIATSALGNSSYNNEYSLGVSNSKISQGSLIFEVPLNAPDSLYYVSSNEQLYGGRIKIITLNPTEIIAFPQELQTSPTSLLDLDLIAHFQPEQFNVSISAGNGGIVDEVSSTFEHQDIIQLKATANAHYNFVRWEGSDYIADSKSPETQLVVKEPSNIQAVFTPVLYPLTITANPEGAVTFTTTNNQLNFPFGTVVEIIANLKPGYQFLEWTGEVQNPNSSTTKVTIDGPKSVLAKIATKPVNIALSTTTHDYLGKESASLVGGSIIGPTITQQNQRVGFTASPKDGFNFIGWYDSANRILSTSKISYFEFVNDSSLQAKFEQQSFKLSVDVQPKYFGTLEWNGEVSLEDINTTLPYGFLVDIKADILNENRFEKWDISSNLDAEVKGSSITFALNDDTYLSADFLPAQLPHLSIQVNPENAGKVVGQGKKSQTDQHYIFATPNAGFSFEKWQGAGITDPLSPNTTISFDQNNTIIAKFKELDGSPEDNHSNESYTLEIYPSHTNHGLTNPTGANVFTKGSISILAKSKPGYVFSHWDGEGVEDIFASSTSVLLKKNTLLAAIFKTASSQQKNIKITKTIETLDYLGNLTNEGNIGGRIIGGSSFLSDYTPTFKAYANDGYDFVRWENGYHQVLSTSEEISYNSQSDFLLKGIFQKKSYTVRILAQPSGNNKVSWEGYGSASSHENLVPHGTKISLTAFNNANHEFLNWSSENFTVQRPKELNLSTSIISDTSITAVYFPLNQITLTTESVPAGGGWVLGGGTFSYNSSHPIHAKPNGGFRFVKWEGLQINSLETPQTTIALDQDRHVKAIFEPDLTYDGGDNPYTPGLHVVQLQSANPTFGNVVGSGVYGKGWINIEAVPLEFYSFSHWEGARIAYPYQAKTKILIEEDVSATAFFKKKALIVDSVLDNVGWATNPWFGSYWNEHFKRWAYHLNLGWIYAHENSISSYWIWINQLNGWYWVEKTSFPYMFESKTKSWVYLSLETSKPNEILLYKFSENYWRRF